METKRHSKQPSATQQHPGLGLAPDRCVFTRSPIEPAEGRSEVHALTPPLEDPNQVRWRLKTNKSSEVFQKIMSDFEPLIVEKYLVVSICEEDNTVTFQDIQEAMDQMSIPEEEPTDDALPFNHPTRVMARRRWQIIKRYIMEKQRKRGGNLAWTMLKHTIKNISNVERGRQRLYEKYLNPRRPRQWAEGIKSIPEDFWRKNKKLIEAKKEEKAEKRGADLPRSKSVEKTTKMFMTLEMRTKTNQ